MIIDDMARIIYAEVLPAVLGAAQGSEDDRCARARATQTPGWRASVEAATKIAAKFVVSDELGDCPACEDRRRLAKQEPHEELPQEYSPS